MESKWVLVPNLVSVDTKWLSNLDPVKNKTKRMFDQKTMYGQQKASNEKCREHTTPEQLGWFQTMLPPFSYKGFLCSRWFLYIYIYKILRLASHRLQILVHVPVLLGSPFKVLRLVDIAYTWVHNEYSTYIIRGQVPPMYTLLSASIPRSLQWGRLLRRRLCGPCF